MYVIMEICYMRNFYRDPERFLKSIKLTCKIIKKIKRAARKQVFCMFILKTNRT